MEFGGLYNENPADVMVKDGSYMPGVRAGQIIRGYGI